MTSIHDDDDTLEDVEELLREIRKRRSSRSAPSSGRAADNEELAGDEPIVGEPADVAEAVPGPAPLWARPDDEDTINVDPAPLRELRSSPEVDSLAGDETIAGSTQRSGADASADPAPNSTEAGSLAGETPQGRAMRHRLPPLARAVLGLLIAAALVGLAFAAGWRPSSGDVSTGGDPVAAPASERDSENTAGDTDMGIENTPTSDDSNGDDTSESVGDSGELFPEVVDDSNGSIAESSDGTSSYDDQPTAVPEPTAVPKPDPYRLTFVSNWEGEQAIYYVDFAVHENEIEILSGWPRLTYSEREEGSPSWSPDGSWIAFQRRAEEGDYWQIFVKSIESPVELQMLCGTDNGWSPDWSPDGMGIAFARGNENENDLYYLDVETLEQFTLKDKSGKTDRRPRWSSDGNHIAFVRGSYPDRRVWVFHLHSEDRNIDEVAIDGGDYSAPDWSPVGNTLAFALRPDGSDYRHIYTVDLRIERPYSNDPEVVLSNRRQITDDAYKDDEPTWSPDGKWIAFTREDQGSRGIYVVSSSGGEPQALAVLPPLDYWAPSWAPSGSDAVDVTLDCRT